MLCAKTLSKNLLSLRKFAELELSIYLDNEKIDIFDPISNDSFITEVYNRPYWIEKSNEYPSLEEPIDLTYLFIEDNKKSDNSKKQKNTPVRNSKPTPSQNNNPDPPTPSSVTILPPAMKINQLLNVGIVQN